MNARGFALLTVLWVIAAVSGAVGLTLVSARLGERATRNRQILARGRWAAEACLAVAQARWGTPRARPADSLDLGRGTRCAWRFDDPGARLNVNVAEREVLRRLLVAAGLGADSSSHLADAIAASRADTPLVSTGQLLDVAGLSARLLQRLTTDGPGTVNISVAPREVLAALPGFTEETIEVALGRRAQSRQVTSLGELAGALSPAAKVDLLQHYADLVGLVTFEPAQLVLTAEGWVEGAVAAPRATIELVLVPLSERLATVRRRMW
jgi:type II secretory pathway component PulK